MPLLFKEFPIGFFETKETHWKNHSHEAQIKYDRPLSKHTDSSVYSLATIFIVSK